MTGMQMSDYGCMLRAYHRNVINNINRCEETTTFIPALAQTFSANPSEIKVAHAERAEGESKYSLYRLIRLNFDLMTGFSVVPLQLFALMGILTSVFSMAFAVFLLIRRFIIGARWKGFSPCSPSYFSSSASSSSASAWWVNTWEGSTRRYANDRATW
ncbi:hypothetical protein [Geotalea toluenoxydans]|uniref:hypothetical protein n=1 Tax=Geotalea toluenoxydans TaxID=421624 RepID=UPI000AB5A2AC|nr:hypothetical protein [Geotalea toluenoxydans]